MPLVIVFCFFFKSVGNTRAVLKKLTYRWMERQTDEQTERPNLESFRADTSISSNKC